jgi:hypothetical protein
MNLKKFTIALGTLVASATLVTAGPASAGHKDGACNKSDWTLDPAGEICLARDLGGGGPMWDWAAGQGNENNFNQPVPERFTAGSTGLVNDNTKSARNRHVGLTSVVYEAVHFEGALQYIYSGDWTNLVPAVRNLASSMRWTE